jgi:hypothetical protein
VASVVWGQSSRELCGVLTELTAFLTDDLRLTWKPSPYINRTRFGVDLFGLSSVYKSCHAEATKPSALSASLAAARNRLSVGPDHRTRTPATREFFGRLRPRRGCADLAVSLRRVTRILVSGLGPRTG